MLAVAFFSLHAAGCDGGEGGSAAALAAWAPGSGEHVAGAASVAQAPPTVPGYSGPMNTDLQSTVDMAIADAARRTGLERPTLKVISSEVVTWPDGSLGCPQPGMNYTMALVPGYRIRIRARAEVLDYHASRRGHLVLCPPGRSVEPVADGTT